MEKTPKICQNNPTMQTRLDKNFTYASRTPGSVAAEEAYKIQITTPRTGLEWDLALKDTRSQLGRLWQAMLSKMALDEKFLAEFNTALAYAAVARTELTYENTRHAEEEDIEAEERARQFQALAMAKAEADMLMASQPTPSWGAGWLDALMKAMQAVVGLMFAKAALKQQMALAAQAWQALHLENAAAVMAGVLNNRLTPADRQVFNVRKEQLMRAVMPVDLQDVFKAHPQLVQAVLEATPGQANTTGKNLGKSLDMMRELNFHAQFTSNNEPLTGAALLAAIQARRAAFQNVSFAVADQAARANLIARQAALFEATRQNQTAMNEAMHGLQALMMHRTPHPGMTALNKRRSQAEEDEEHAKRLRPDPLRTRRY